MSRRKNLFLLFLFAAFLVGTLNIDFVSAALCSSGSGYYYDCNYNTFGNYYPTYPSGPYYYKNYDIANYAPKPIFKGPYGNYRYEMYAYHGDMNNFPYLQGFSYSGYGYPVFSGGYYGFHGYGMMSPWFWY